MPEILDQHGRPVQVIHRNIEVALNLRRVQVKRQCAACAGGLEKVGDEFGGYRDAGLVLAVLPGIA